MGLINLGFIAGGLVLGAVVGYILRSVLASKGLALAEHKAKELLGEAEVKSKGLVLEAEEKAAAILSDIKEEERSRKKEFAALEARFLEREDLLNRKLSDLDREEKKWSVLVHRLGLKVE